MSTLYLAWQDRRSRRWFPVGRLIHEGGNSQRYEFVYIEGARRAKELAGFMEIPGFPNLDREYRSGELFPAFRNRTMNVSRPDRAGYLWHLGLDVSEWDAVTELSVSGGKSQSDGFEVFPAIVPDDHGRFRTRFILHGIRHLNPHSIERSESLVAGDVLRLAFELNNPVAGHAVLVISNDYYTLGWLPRYLVEGMHKDHDWLVSDVRAVVAQMNFDAPLSNRVLVDFSGRLPAGCRPMEELADFAPIPKSVESVPTRA